MRRTLSALLALTALTGSAAAQVTAEQRVLREVVTTTEDGRRVVTEEPAALVAPGDRIVYRLAFRNEGAEPATGLALVMPVPVDIAFVPGSAEGPGAVAYSVDGETYAPLGALVLPDGQAATPGDVRSVRWTLAEPLAPGARGEIAYKGVLR